MLRFIGATSLIVAIAARAPGQEIPAPAALFGHEPGQRFTHVRQVRAWFEAAARAAPDRVSLREMGRSYGGRPLYLAIVGSARNLARFDAEIAPGWRALVEGTKTPGAGLPPIVWLSFGVHGNESSATEVAPLVAHALLTDAVLAPVLDRVVAVIDPCLNPDGRERYLAGFEDRSGLRPDPDPRSIEHVEPWPGGRTNHFLQDLNRDWAFQSQRETRLRIAAWLEMPPQVHLDYHEMFPEEEYFFFPAEVPVNRHVSKRILDWHDTFGRANARAFDARRWRYYSAEDFDLFYPGYGDSWPSLIGAVGMTFEVGGHGAGGLAYRRRSGAIWALRDRIDRHFVTSIEVLKATAAGADRLRRDFHAIHREAEAWGRGRTRRFLCVPGDERVASLIAFADLLRRQGLRVLRTEARGRIRSAEPAGDLHPLPGGSLVVDLAQPRGRLAAALLEPDAEISHLYFYDVSAWSLPFAFGLRHVWAREVTAPTSTWRDPEPRSVTLPDDVVAVVVDARSSDVPLLAQHALEAGVAARLAAHPFRLGGEDFATGSLVLLPEREQHDAVQQVLGRFPWVRARPTTSTMSERGPDLGSSSFETLALPRPAMVFGEGTSLATAGVIWHLFERDLALPLTRFPPARLRAGDLDRYNVLILPGGALPNGLRGSHNAPLLRRWLEEGGVLLAMGSGAAGVHREILGARPERTQPSAATAKKEAPATWKPLAVQREEARRASSPGAIVEVAVDPDHVLAAGYDARLPVLVRGSGPGFPAGGPGHVVAHYGEAERLSGYLPKEAAARLRGTGYLLHARVGRGAVVLFDQDPQFRLIWHGLTRMLLNAALLLPRRDVRNR